ncbi:hypothetical protein E4T39_07220 [Aureobasidium subglaciale]|nr:hypothetical protein E4T39_07220 [Aureobasidium subglaciale]
MVQDSVDNDGAVKKRSQLPQLTPRSLKTTKDVSSSSLPMSSPTRPAMALPARAKEDKTAMPPPTAPLTRTKSIRTRPISQAPSSTTSTGTRSGLVAPSRSLSTRAPGPVSTIAAPKSRVPSHSRTSSTSTIAASSTGDSTVKRSATINSSRHLRSQSSITTGLKSRLTTPSTPSTPTSEKSSADPVKPLVRRLVRPRATSGAPSLEPPRPTFSTLQQHYSPAKTTLPKPPVPSSRAAPSAEDKAVHSGAAFETTKLQSELLYLSILHEAAGPNLRSYEKSARKALQAEFEEAQQEVAQIREEERTFQEKGNLVAIAAWLGIQGAHIGPEAAEMIQSLSGCFNELVMLSAPESKYTALVHTFSEWASEATEQDRAHMFSGPLPQEWHHMHASIAQRLRLVEREVEMLPSAPPRTTEDGIESSLAITLRCLKDLVLGMKEELEAMVRLEQQVVSTEKQRVDKAVAGLSMEALLQSSEEWMAAWYLEVEQQEQHTDRGPITDVDSFHPQAHPSIRTLELHGYLRSAVCTTCRTEYDRQLFQNDLAQLNPAWSDFLNEMLASGALTTENPEERRRLGLKTNPDGDVDVPGVDYATFRYPACPSCLAKPPKDKDGKQHVIEVDVDGAWLAGKSTAGILKPNVIMFGESIPDSTKTAAEFAIDEASRILVLGSSLATYSAWRLVKRAREQAMPIGIVNIGGVRGEEQFFGHLKEGSTGKDGLRCAHTLEEMLPSLVKELGQKEASSFAATGASRPFVQAPWA